MKTFFQDEYMNSKLLKRVVREIKKEQLEQTINEMNNFNRFRRQTTSKNEFITQEQSSRNEFLNRFNNGKPNI